MSNFYEFERRCQEIFESCGEVYHAYTSGKETPILFINTEELSFVMNVIAYVAYRFQNTIKIIAFEVMDNHFHFILSGCKNDISEFFKAIVKKLKRTIPQAGKLALYFKPIPDLNAMRNNIVYTNRNGYVVNPNHTPFSYPWGTGRYYFNDASSLARYEDISFEKKREMMKGRAIDFPPDWQVTDGYISPASYCAIGLGMAMFRDAHHYFSMISKNVEAYSGIAVDIDDGEFLTDQELFSEVLKILRTRYDGTKPAALSPAQKLDLARTLHYDYHSSNGQIRRILGLGEYEVKQLFPK